MALPSEFSEHNRPPPAITAHQLAAAAEPDRPISDLVGNFGDFDHLFEPAGAGLLPLHAALARPGDPISL